MKRPNFTKMTPREVKTFVGNAQLALTEHVPMDRITAVYYYKEHLLSAFQPSPFSPHELATVLVSLAWDLLNGKQVKK